MRSEPPREAGRPTKARDLRNVGNELAGLASDLAETLRADWARAIGDETPGPRPGERSTGVCIRYGQRLGELSQPTKGGVTLIEGEIGALREASARDAHSRLARLSSRAGSLLTIDLSTLMVSRKELAVRLGEFTSQLLEVRGNRPFRLHRFLFYLIPAFIALAAEGALAEDITRTAFRLKGNLWWLFPLALLTLPLVFKEALDWFSLTKIQRAYIGFIIMLLMIIIGPIACTRSERVFRGGGQGARSAPIIDPFALPPQIGGATPSNPPQPSASRDMVVRMTIIFTAFGILFPMVSGLCFYWAWGMADTGLDSWRIKKEIKTARAGLKDLDSQAGTLRAELDGIQLEIVRLVAGLGPGDWFIEKMIADLMDSLRGADSTGLEKIQQIIASRDDVSLMELAKRLAFELGTLDLKDDLIRHEHVRFQRGLLGGITQVKEGDLLAKIAAALERKALAALSDGHAIGEAAPFSVMDGHEPEELKDLIRQRRLRDALFKGKWGRKQSDDIRTEGEDQWPSDPVP